MEINYIARIHRVDEQGYRFREYLFKIYGDQPEIVGVRIVEDRHATIPLLDWVGAEKELRTAAQRFLEKKCRNGWVPTAENSRLEVSNGEMEMFMCS
jgi:hypothetical protein